MFARIASLSVLALALVASASPSPKSSTSQCDAGTLQCCQTVGKSNDPSIAKELGLLGVVVQGVAVPIGISCTPITVIGVGSGANCAQQPACCTGEQDGLVTLGCTPINAGL
ncbi:hypothetical protein EW146_g6668 [Bondarzewia mesenterica]|uniref:Hydrophobin n=1 Tax=Bondarzewia mesenterica TaxID=1095465 RepID=A0A4S4LPR1_9AGAM|nr:hypothetical protein EW146_g6668 [Bondarzewia mesenterica]